MTRLLTILAALLLPLFAFGNPTATTVEVTVPACDNVAAIGQQIDATVSKRVLLDSTAPYDLADAAVVATVSAGQATYIYTGLTAATDYGLGYDCIDGAGNIGARSTALVITTSASSALPIGTLAHDGPATPEQLSLVLPVTGALTNDATATVRYRVSGAGSWVTGHPLYRVRPTYTQVSGYWPGGAVEDVFAWPIIDLSPGVSYDVEVTVDDGVTSEVQTETFTTRALPAPAGAVTTTITAGSTRTQIETALNAASAGDVIQFENGTHDLGGSALQLDMTGTAINPIYVRGESRDGVVLTNGDDRILYFVAKSDYVIFENMTLDGPAVDTSSGGSPAVQFWDGAAPSTFMTFRNMDVTGFDKVLVSFTKLESFLVYDNTFTGNNDWTQDLWPGGGNAVPDVTEGYFWNDDGVNLSGLGHAVFNNTFRGFGDSLSMCSHSGPNAVAECRNQHWYRNDIYESGDDCAEMDYSFRNTTMYDNRCTNGMTAVSLDNAFGGPFLIARNIFTNIGRSPYKFNGTVSGMFVYNNTLTTTDNNVVDAGWYQPNNGANRSWGYRNNIMVHLHTSDPTTFITEASAQDPIDFTHNSWYSDKKFTWNNSNGGTNTNLATQYATIGATTPIFSGETKRHESDNILAGQPYATDLVLGADYFTEVTGSPLPVLDTGTNANNSGVAIPGITNGFTGVAPDRGALIAGRTEPDYGDRSGAPVGDTNFLDSIVVGTVQQIPNTKMDSADPCPARNCVYSGSGGQAAVMGAWGGGAWDYTRGCLIVAGGGHGDYQGNEVYRICVRDAVPAWERLRDPSIGADFSNTEFWDCTVQTHPDGSMRARHTRSGMTYTHLLGGQVVFTATDGLGPFVCGSRRTWIYPADGAGDYVRVDDSQAGGIPQGSATTHPDTGIIWMIHNSTSPFYRFDLSQPTGSQWTVQRADDWGGFQTDGAIDTARNNYLVAMNTSLDCFAKLWDLDNPTAAPTILSTELATLCNKNGGLVYDALRDEYVAWQGDNTLAIIDPVTFAVVTETFTGVMPPGFNESGTTAGVYGRFAYDDVKDVYILAATNVRDVYAFRRAAP